MVPAKTAYVKLGLGEEMDVGTERRCFKCFLYSSGISHSKRSVFSKATFSHSFVFILLLLVSLPG